MFGELPSWAFYVRHVRGLIIKNISIKAEAPDYRPAFVFDDVKTLHLSELKISEDDRKPQLFLKDITDTQFDNSIHKISRKIKTKNLMRV